MSDNVTTIASSKNLEDEKQKSATDKIPEKRKGLEKNERGTEKKKEIAEMNEESHKKQVLLEQKKKEEPVAKKPKVKKIPDDNDDWYSEIPKLHEILPSLFLSGSACASSRQILKENNIQGIVNTAKGVSNFFKNDPSLSYFKIKLADFDGEKINLPIVTPKLVQFVDEVLARKGAVLFHCESGISRSSTILLAYLMQGRKMALDDAYNAILEKRWICKPNPGYAKQLCRYEVSLFGFSSNSKLVSDKEEVSSSEEEEISPQISSSEEEDNSGSDE